MVLWGLCEGWYWVCGLGVFGRLAAVEFNRWGKGCEVGFRVRG